MAQPSRADLIAMMSRPRAAAPKDFWTDLLDQIRRGRAIAVLSDGLRLDRIFALDSTNETGPPSPAEELLVPAWAHPNRLNYPFPVEGETLARVAQYNLVTHEGDSERAKLDYLRFLKEALLQVAQLDSVAAEQIEEEALWDLLPSYTFADLANTLGYPSQPADEDCLRLLARLPFAVYITTSPFPFLQRALALEGRQNVRTQVCLWKGRPLDLKPEHEPESDLLLDPAAPLVYHLFGHEAYPASMVLSEDDYLEYLVAFSERCRDQIDPILPHTLREALVRSSLLLLGYKLRAWDFRVLFRALRHLQRSEDRLFRLVIQLDPKHQEGIQNVAAAQTYLREYFKQEDYKVELDDAEGFVQQLYYRWRQSAQSSVG